MLSPGPYPCIQIADFGLARPRGYQETLNVCGTVSYLPPEGILALDHKHLGYVGMSADCWSAGVILFVMLSYVLSHHATSNMLTFCDTKGDRTPLRRECVRRAGRTLSTTRPHWIILTLSAHNFPSYAKTRSRSG